MKVFEKVTQKQAGIPDKIFTLLAITSSDFNRNLEEARRNQT